MDGTGEVWKVDHWASMQSFEGTSGRMTVIRITRDEKYVFTATCRRRARGIIQIWDIGRETCAYFRQTSFLSLRTMKLLRNENRAIINRSGNTLVVWKIEKRVIGSQESDEDVAHEGIEPHQEKEIEVHSTIICNKLINDGSRLMIGFGDGSIQL